MPLFSWLFAKPKSRRTADPESSGLSRIDPTRPVNGPGAAAAKDPLGNAQPANRKGERMARRELLYTVVRDAMMRAGILTASYKFKVLSLDARGRQFLVMVDLARDAGGETGRLAEIEAAVAQSAKSRYDIIVTAVYWRTHEHVAVGTPSGRPLQGRAGVPSRPQTLESRPQTLDSRPVQLDSRPGTLDSRPVVLDSRPVVLDSRPVVLDAAPPAATANAAAAATVAASTTTAVAAAATAASAPVAVPAPSLRKPGQRFEPIAADEVAAFKRALAVDAAGKPDVPSRAALPEAAMSAAEKAAARPGPQSYTLLTGFEDTEMRGDSQLPALSATQYGDLH